MDYEFCPLDNNTQELREIDDPLSHVGDWQAALKSYGFSGSAIECIPPFGSRPSLHILGPAQAGAEYEWVCLVTFLDSIKLIWIRNARLLRSYLGPVTTSAEFACIDSEIKRGDRPQVALADYVADRLRRHREQANARRAKVAEEFQKQ